MICDGEGSLLEPIHRMTAFAFAAVLPACELAIVRIGLVTVSAELVGNGFLEIAGTMTAAACRFEVLSEKRILRLRVVKTSGEAGLLPGNGVVARFAALLERSAVHISMTRRALLKT